MLRPNCAGASRVIAWYSLTDSIGWGISATKPCRRTPMSSSLLSDPSTVKLFARDRVPLTENWPAEPTPAPTPGPATLPSVCGGGATPGNSKANSSNDLVNVIDTTVSRETYYSVDDELRCETARWIE